MAAEEQLISYISQEGAEKFKNACYLNDKESKNDPENDPYKSKYKAREIWTELKKSLEEIKEESPTDTCTFLIAGVDLKLGVNYTETEELASGQSHLEFCILALADHKMNVKACNILQHAHNQLGILWTGRHKPRDALGHLQRAESLYKDFKHKVGNAPYTLEELFQTVNEEEDPGEADQRRTSNFEDTYTHTLYYLAQVFTQLNEIKKSAEYCHITLKRQLDTMKYEPMEWALNAATLSQYYITISRFKMARHCLASASVILKELGEPVTKCEVNDEDSQMDVDQKEKLPKCWSDLYRCWAKYGLALLETSRDRLLRDIPDNEGLEDEESKTPQEKDEEDHNADKKPIDTSSFENSSQAENDKPAYADVYFNLEVTVYEEQISDKWVKVFDDARPVFLCIQKWLNLAKEFYVLDGHCTDHVEIIQDHSTAFKQLAFYELDLERQCKMHKRRIDMLEDILKQLSTQFYMLICRQLMFEIAETYSQMLDLKLAVIQETGNPPTQHAVKKITSLSQNSIATFTTYLNTLKTGNKFPDKFAEDDEKPALIAHFYIGRLYSKFMQFDVDVHLSNLKHSLDSYTFLVEYCRKHTSAQAKVPSEFEVCSEMITLLPHKMEKIRIRGAIL